MDGARGGTGGPKDRHVPLELDLFDGDLNYE